MTVVNEAGIRPLEFRVLVKPDQTEQVTQGGIYIPDNTHEREGFAQVKGTLVAYGDSAFQDWSEQERTDLQPGARVYYSKYQGIMVNGADGDDYRLMNDKDIGAIIQTESAGASTILKGRTKGGLTA